MTTIYVGNLPFSANEGDVRVLFERHGKVDSVKLINDRETGRPRGFGFVEMPSADAQTAIAALNGKLARDYGVMPMWADDQSIDLIVTDPFNTQAVDDLTFALGRNVRLHFGDPDKVEVQIKQHYGEDEETIDDLLQEIGTGKVAAAAGAAVATRARELPCPPHLPPGVVKATVLRAQGLQPDAGLRARRRRHHALRAAAAEPSTHALAFLALHRLQAARPELFA